MSVLRRLEQISSFCFASLPGRTHGCINHEGARALAVPWNPCDCGYIMTNLFVLSVLWCIGCTRLRYHRYNKGHVVRQKVQHEARTKTACTQHDLLASCSRCGLKHLLWEKDQRMIRWDTCVMCQSAGHFEFEYALSKLERLFYTTQLKNTLMFLFEGSCKRWTIAPTLESL